MPVLPLVILRELSVQLPIFNLLRHLLYTRYQTIQYAVHAGPNIETTSLNMPLRPVGNFIPPINSLVKSNRVVERLHHVFFLSLSLRIWVKSSLALSGEQKQIEEY
ncbi:hypothetical protein ACTXT7_010194 [Hymenolepis weldensis]